MIKYWSKSKEIERNEEDINKSEEIEIEEPKASDKEDKEPAKIVQLDPSIALIANTEEINGYRRTPHPITRLETLKKQESEDVTQLSLQPNCNSPHDKLNLDTEDDEEELQKLSWDSDSDERIDLGLEDGTPLKVQVETGVVMLM